MGIELELESVRFICAEAYALLVDAG